MAEVHINSCDFSLGNYCFDPVEDAAEHGANRNALLV